MCVCVNFRESCHTLPPSPLPDTLHQMFHAAFHYVVSPTSPLRLPSSFSFSYRFPGCLSLLSPHMSSSYKSFFPYRLVVEHKLEGVLTVKLCHWITMRFLLVRKCTLSELGWTSRHFAYGEMGVSDRTMALNLPQTSAFFFWVQSHHNDLQFSIFALNVSLKHLNNHKWALHL